MSIWNSDSSSDNTIMSFVRSLFFLSVEFNINIIMKHFPVRKNVFADLLSRFQIRRFLALCPEASRHPSVIHHQVWECFSKD